MEFLQHRNAAVPLSILILCICISLLAQRAFQVKHVVCMTDARFALLSKKMLRNNILQLIKKRTAASKTYEHLHALIPAVYSLDIRYKPNQTAQVHITSQVPHACIIFDDGRECVVTKQGALVKPEFFAAYALNHLSAVCYAHRYKTIEHDELCVNIISQLPQDILNIYDLTWFSAYDIKLIPRNKQQRYSIRATSVQLVEHRELNDMLQTVSQIYTEKKTSNLRKWKRGLEADIRLRDRIVIKPM